MNDYRFITPILYFCIWYISKMKCKTGPAPCCPTWCLHKCERQCRYLSFPRLLSVNNSGKGPQFVSMWEKALLHKRLPRHRSRNPVSANVWGKKKKEIRFAAPLSRVQGPRNGTLLDFGRGPQQCGRPCSRPTKEQWTNPQKIKERVEVAQLETFPQPCGPLTNHDHPCLFIWLCQP